MTYNAVTKFVCKITKIVAIKRMFLFKFTNEGGNFVFLKHREALISMFGEYLCVKYFLF